MKLELFRFTKRVEEKMNIRLIRHAESTGNVENRWVGRVDAPLSEAGRLQAVRLRTRFEGEGYVPTHVYASPLSRAFETARITAADWDCPVEPWGDLVELRVGVFSNMTAAEIEEAFPKLAREFAETRNFDIIEGAETNRECNERAQRVVDRLASEHKNSDRVVLFSHGGILRHIIARLLGTEQVWTLDIGNTSIFEFTVDVESWHLDPKARTNLKFWRIDRFNDMAHLRDG